MRTNQRVPPPLPLKKHIDRKGKIQYEYQERYLRPNRFQWFKQRPGYVRLSIHAFVPLELNRRLRQLSTFDDRTLSELAVLGLTWVCTEWAQTRIPPGVDIKKVKPYGRKKKVYRYPYGTRGKPAYLEFRPHTFPHRLPRWIWQELERRKLLYSRRTASTNKKVEGG